MKIEKIGKLLSVKNLTRIFFATNVVAFGVALLLKAGLGTDPLTVLQDGVHARLSITVGQAALLYNGLILSAALILARKRLGLGTVIYSLTVGFFIDCYLSVLRVFSIHGWILFLPGLAVMCLGSSLIINLNLGQNGLDALLLTLQEKKRVRYVVGRTSTDALYTLAGWLMGGTVGAGTILAILLSGFLIGRFGSLLSGIQIRQRSLCQCEKKE